MPKTILFLRLVLASGIFAGSVATAYAADTATSPVPTTTMKALPKKSTAARAGGPLVIAQQGYFFVNGRYTAGKDGQIMVGQMFVQYQIPQQRTQ